MVLPDGTESDRSRPRKGRLILLVVATLVMVAGSWALGSLIPSRPIAMETTTTTSTTVPELQPPIDMENFSISQIATGPPLEWSRAASSPIGYPLTVTEHDGTFYLFASDQPTWAPDPGGLVTWTSTNGEDWNRSGGVGIGREFKVTHITATPDGFAAAGLRPGDDGLIIWHSEDAIQWTARKIPTGADSGYLMPRPTAMTLLGERVVVAADHQLDREGLLQDRLAAAGMEVDMSSLRWDTRYGGEDGIELTLLGPFGMSVLTTELATLNLTEQEHEWLMREETRDADTPVWVIDGNGDWESGTIPLTLVTNMASRQDDTLIATGPGGAGITDTMISDDGLNWHPPEEDASARSAIISWDDRLISFSTDLRPQVLMSKDGQTWRETGLMAMFPSNGRWYPGAMGASREGLAMTVEGQNNTGLSSTGESEVTLTNEAATLTLSLQRGELTLETDGETHTWVIPRPGTSGAVEGLEADLATSSFRFLEPGTGETLAEFSFEALHRAEARARTAQFSDIVTHHALVFTRDGEDWEIRDLGAIVEDDSRVRLLGVAFSRLVAVLEEPSFGPDGIRSSGFEIWTAPIP